MIREFPHIYRDVAMEGSLADLTRQAITSAMRDSDRSRYSKDKMIGVSDIGTCREYARRMILNEPWSDEQDDYMAAFIGTAVGDHLEKAALANGSVSSAQGTVVVDLDVRGYRVSIPGHSDIVGDNFVADFKSKSGLGVVRREGPSRQQVFQITLYAKALIDGGVLNDDCTVALIFIDRSGDDPDPVVFAWQYDTTIVDEIIQWLDDVIYAVENGEEASKDQPRDWCFKACPYATSCRGFDTDVTGLVEDPTVLDAIEVYREANATIRAAEKDKKSAMSVLAGVAGSTGKDIVRWITIPGGHVEYDRAEYQRIDIRPIKKGSK